MLDVNHIKLAHYLFVKYKIKDYSKMPTTYTVNGKPATEADYKAAVAGAGISFPSVSDLNSAEKISNPAILGEPTNTSSAPPDLGTFDPGSGVGWDANDNGVPPGAEPPEDQPVSEINIMSMDRNFDPRDPDLRVKIRVPADYLTPLTRGSGRRELVEHSGIIFPYTPQIDFEYKADYTQQTPTHSNYALAFYKNSSVSDISIQGKFTVENDTDAMIYLSTIHLLKSLTKMRFGGIVVPGAGGGRGAVSHIDADSGAPPPVCRLDAYGDFMFKNVPVVITSFKNTLPDNVDFYTLDKSNTADANQFGKASVPVLSTIAIVCKPMYSRAEMQGMSVTRYLKNNLTKQAGYL
jgi:hypothetical protein